MTQDQRYTLSNTTTSLLSSLENPLKIDIFLTGQLPADYLRLQREITTLIKGMEEAYGSIDGSFIDPFEGAPKHRNSNRRNDPIRIGPRIHPSRSKASLEQTIIFPWAIVNDGNKDPENSLLKKVLGDDEQQKINRSIAQLEFHFLRCVI